MTKTYDFIIPLGSYCITSMRLRGCGCQYESLPFDWIIIGMGTAVGFICNNFEGFLDKTQLRHQENVPEFKYDFLDSKNRVLFRHDFHSLDLETEFPIVKAKFDRRIKRLYKRIQEAGRILVVRTQGSWESEMAVETLIAEQQRLQNRFPGKKFDILCVKLHEKIADETVAEPAPGIFCARLSLEEDHWAKAAYRRLLKNFRLKWYQKLAYFFPNLYFRQKKKIRKIYNKMLGRPIKKEY